LEEGDTVGADNIAKLFTNAITSSLILSFNPLGRVKYGIKDVATKVGDTVKKVGKAVGDWATDKVDADQAEKAIRKLGKVRTTFLDSRDGKKKTGSFSTAGVNVGKIESLGKMGHYKVLTGNPGTQDFQVFHLYRNGNKYRVLDARTALEADEAKWVYDNNLPKDYSESDWKNDGSKDFMKQLDEEDNVTETKQEKTQTEEVSSEENNVSEEPVEENTEVEQTEEDNLIDDMDPDTWWDIENPGTIEEDNVTEIKKQKQKQKVRSSLEEDDEEDNVIESKPRRKKSKYNGMNVTGCVEADGTVALASFIRQNLIDFHNAMANKNITGKPKEQLDKVMKELKSLLSVDPKLVSEMTKTSKDNLTIDFSKVPNANMKYVITLDFTGDTVQVSGSGIEQYGKTEEEKNDRKLEFTLDCLKKVAKTIAGV
jgi:hypothetical protein